METCLQCRLCGLFHNAANGAHWTVQDTIAVDQEPLGYTYEFIEPPPVAISEPLPHPAAPMIIEANRAVVQLKSMDFRIPETEPKRSLLALEGIVNLNQTSFDLLVFITPQGQPISPRSPAFVQNHLTEILSIWQVHDQHASHHSMLATMDRRVDITNALRKLSANHSGETWTIAVAAVADLPAVPEDISRDLSAFHDDSSGLQGTPENIGFTEMRLEIEGK